MNRSAARFLVVAAVVAATLSIVLGPVLTSREVAAAPGDANEIVAVVVDGVGNGHGRGLSQWGSYGWAVNYSWDWTQILDHYYGGTTLGDAANNAITVRLLALDDQLQTAVISATGMANWGGTGNYGTLVTREVDAATRRFQVWGNATPSCPAADDPLAGWTYLGEVSGSAAGAPAVEFTTPAGNDPHAAPGDLLGVCGAGGVVDHYRGSIYAANGTVGENRTVNRVLIESYLRGVVPRESPASWGLAGGGKGANALRAQSVAARSYALTQGRYSYANTCDSSACQVYGGAGWRVSASSTGATSREHELTDAAIAATAGKVRRWPSTGLIVSTEFSASNGPRTAGGSFPAVDDPADSVAENPLHRWTRVIDADALAERFDLGTLTAAYTERDPATLWDGQWGNRVQLQGTTGASTMSALSFRGSYGLPSHGISIRVITRDMVTPQDFAFIGDSVGFSITDTDTSELSALLDGVFASTVFDVVGGRCTAAPNCIGTTGVQAAQAIPNGTEIAIVELGYNDPSGFAAKIDQVMTALRGKGVSRVGWVTMSERRTTSGFAAANQALNAARARWPELVVLDWNAASSGADKDRWYADDVHLTSTGQSEFALWLRSQVLALATAGPGKLGAGRFLRIKIPGVGDVPASGVTAVALNVTAVDPSGWGFFTVWPCGSPMPPDASHVNFLSPGAVEPNSVLALVDASGEVCVWTYAASHVLVDVNGWFTSGFRGRAPLRIVDTRSGQGAPLGRLPAGQTLRVPVSGRAGVPTTGVSAVALNVTAVEPTGWGFFTVWPCGSPMPLDASHVNFIDAGAVEPNSVLAPVDSTGEVCIWTYADSHVLVDVNGWFDVGSFEGRAPVRVVDTREGRGAPLGRLGAGQTLRVPVSGVGGVPAGGVSAVALNVTAAETAGWGFFTVWPCGSPMPPDASQVNFIGAGEVEPNSVLVPVDSTGEVCIWTYAAAHVLVDVNGWFTSGFEGRAPRRFVDTRSGQFSPL